MLITILRIKLQVVSTDRYGQVKKLYMLSEWKEARILIWGKTYPELSSKYNETVCTGGTLENGDFIRIYPIPFRYLSEESSFQKYQWIRARIKKSGEDPRPESYKIDPASIIVEEKVQSDKFEWIKRQRLILSKRSLIFDSAESLLEENRRSKRSIGFVKPFKIDEVYLEERPIEDYETFLRKFQENKEKAKQIDLFGNLTIQEIKELKYISKRFKVKWRCNEDDCGGHDMSILDWEVYALQRRVGDMAALDRVKSYLLSNEYAIGFFLGNFRLHPTAFSIGAIWYPKKSNTARNLELF